MKHVIFFSVIVFLTMSQKLSAWSSIEHDAVAYIAECHLTPLAKERIESYLEGRSIVYYTSWMDHYRKTPEYLFSDTWHMSIADENFKYIDADNKETYRCLPALEETVDKLENYQDLNDSTVAVNLSEGERNFIAFLYFYQLVRGSHSDSDVSKDKIVVIDDPVSSMDSSVLFIVSTLVREMVGVCFNNAEYLDSEREVQGDYIKQIIVLTHNVYFHREITYNLTRHYRCVSLFVVSKASNNSTIRPCVRRSQRVPTEQENFNPVQNSYAALWGEYREIRQRDFVVSRRGVRQCADPDMYPRHEEPGDLPV